MRLQMPTAQVAAEFLVLLTAYALTAVLHEVLGHGLSFAGLVVSGVGVLVVYRFGWAGLMLIVLPIEAVVLWRSAEPVHALPEILEHFALLSAIILGFQRDWHHFHVVRLGFWNGLLRRVVFAALLPTIAAAVAYFAANYVTHLLWEAPLEPDEAIEALVPYFAGILVVGLPLTALRDQLAHLVPALREPTNWIVFSLVALTALLGNLDDETSELVELYEVALGFSIAIVAAAIAGAPLGALSLLLMVSARLVDELRGSGDGQELDDEILVQIAIALSAAVLVMYFEYRANLTRATHQRLRLYRDIVESANEAFLVTLPAAADAKPTRGESILLANSAAVTLTGLSKDELHGRSPEEIWRKTTISADESNLVYFADETQFAAKQFKAERKDGVQLWVSRTVRTLSEEQWNPKPTVHQLRDISTSVSLRTQLQALLFRYELIWHAVRDVLIVTDSNGLVLDWNSSAVGYLGYAAEEAIGSTSLWRRLALVDDNGAIVEPSRFKALDERAAHGELPIHRGVRRDGTYFWASVNVRQIPTLEPQEQAWFICITPQTQQVADAARLTLLAFSDPLTGLPNRRALEDTLAALLSDDADQTIARRVCVCFIDLDGFNAVNALHGHAEGDNLLVRVAATMRTEMREGETLSRLAGDEFVAVLLNVDDQAQALERANELLARVRQVTMNAEQRSLTASIGIACACAETNAPSGRALVRRANAAMRRAKLAGRNLAAVFDPAMSDSTDRADEVSRMVMSNAFTGAIVVLFQPVVELDGKGFAHLEALSRLQLDAERLIAAGEFIPVAEELRRTVALTTTVLAHVERFARQAHAKNKAVPSMSVNVVADDLLDRELCVSVLRTQTALMQFGGELWIEITERVAMSAGARRAIETLAARGVRFSLDDFGVGYSNLGAIASGGWSAIKLDASLTRDAATSKQTQRLLQATVDTFAGTDIAVIAEGIENAAQLQAMHVAGVRFFQGFHLCRPTPAELLFEMLPERDVSLDENAP